MMLTVYGTERRFGDVVRVAYLRRDTGKWGYGFGAIHMIEPDARHIRVVSGLDSHTVPEELVIGTGLLREWEPNEYQRAWNSCVRLWNCWGGHWRVVWHPDPATAAPWLRDDERFEWLHDPVPWFDSNSLPDPPSEGAAFDPCGHGFDQKGKA